MEQCWGSFSPADTFLKKKAKILKMKANPLKLSRSVCIIVNNYTNRPWQAVWSPELLAEAS